MEATASIQQWNLEPLETDHQHLALLESTDEQACLATAQTEPNEEQRLHQEEHPPQSPIGRHSWQQNEERRGA